MPGNIPPDTPAVFFRKLAAALLKPLPGAYRGARTVFWLQIAIWESLIFASMDNCDESGRLLSISLSLLSITVCITLWLNHVAAIRAGMAGWRLGRAIVKGFLFDLIALFARCFLIAIPVALVAPQYQCYTPRAKVSELILYASGFKQQIADRTLQRGTTAGSGAGLKVAHSGRALGGLVTDSGVIIVAGDDPPAVLIMAPRIEGGRVMWQCRVYPDKVAPASCRDHLSAQKN